MTLGNVFQATPNRLGARGALRAKFAKGEPDFSVVVPGLAAANALVLHCAACHRKVAPLLCEVRKEDMADLRLVSSDDLNARDLWSVVGAVGQGGPTTFEAEPRRTPEGANVARRFGAASLDLTACTSYSYAEVRVFAHATAALSPVQPAPLPAAVRREGRKSATVLGRIRIGLKCDPVTRLAASGSGATATTATPRNTCAAVLSHRVHEPNCTPW